MLKRFFLSRQGQQVGPYTVNEVLEKLQSQEHAWNDYIYEESREEWILLLEHPFFAEKYNQGWARGPGATVQISQKVWLIMKDDKKFGPFDYLEVVQMLQERTLNEQDLVATVSSSVWKKVKDYEEFSSEKIRELLVGGDRYTKEVFNRRRYPRAGFDGSLIVHDNKTVFRGQSFELSAGGAGLFIPSQALQPGQTLLLHFHPTPDVPAFNAVATVVSKNPAKDKNLRYGVKFTSISQSVKERIYSYTNKKKDAA